VSSSADSTINIRRSRHQFIMNIINFDAFTSRDVFKIQLTLQNSSLFFTFLFILFSSRHLFIHLSTSNDDRFLTLFLNWSRFFCLAATIVSITSFLRAIFDQVTILFIFALLFRWSNQDLWTKRSSIISRRSVFKFEIFYERIIDSMIWYSWTSKALFQT
jgi:hypothetical protein